MYKFLFIILCALNCTVVNADYSSEQVWISIKSHGGIEVFLKKMAVLASKNLPQKLDAETETFSVSSLDKTIHFNTRSINYEKSEILNIESLKNTSINKSSNLLCSSPVAKVLINEADASYSYSHHSKSYEFIFKYIIDKSKCKNLHDK